MAVKMSSDRSGADKVRRKAKAALAKSRGSSDGVRTLEGKSSDTVGKARGKVRVAVGKSGGSSEGVRAPEPKKRQSRQVQSRGSGKNAVSDFNVNGKSSKPRGKRDYKTNSGNGERFGADFEGKSGGKRKRIYADRGISEDRMLEGGVKKIDKKFISRGEKDLVGSYLDKGKKATRGKARESEHSRENASSAPDRKLTGNVLHDQRKWRGKMEGTTDKLKRVQESGFGNGKTKTNDRLRTPLATKKHEVVSVEKPRRQKHQSKKSVGADSELTEEPPKKKKRVIRLDPNDISNKRLADEMPKSGVREAKKDLTENSTGEMSKNAQFRAIRPSASILSFVEDNLLGRRRDIEFRRAGYNTELSAPLDNIPLSTGPERERIEVPAFRNKLEFFAAAKISSSFPPPDLPEIAFAGRSNVGKSSLLNSLTRQWGVVRTSDKPGLTQSINFFKLGTKLCLVDLPGYGFAYAKEEVKEAWEELVKEYVTTRVGLKRVCLLVDTKWGMKPRDHELIDLMERSQTKYQIVLTKTDLVFPIDVARRAMQIEENLKAKKSAVQPLMMLSSKTGAGIRSLRTVLANIGRLVRR